MTCIHVVDSGVYVLGALAPAQRFAFEQHMMTCSECQAEVNELAVLPGLLGRLDEPSVEASADLPVPSALPGVLAKVHRQRRGRRLLAGAAALLVAAVALIAGLNLPHSGAHTAAGSTSSVVLHNMTAVDPTSVVTAQVGFTPVLGGTQIVVKCQYPKESGTSADNEEWFGLYAIPRSGKPAQQLGTWTSRPGDVVDVPATITSWPVEKMSRIELRDAAGHTLLYYNL